MESSERLRETFERNKKALGLRPAVGRGTATTRASWVDGVNFEVEDGAWKLSVDMSEKSGGKGTAPDPGVYGRSALASCLGINYALHAAARGLRISSLEVEVQADYDSNGNYGTIDQPPGYRQVRYIVTIDADASADEIESFVEEVDRFCPYLDIFVRPIDVRREIRVTAGQE